MPYSMFSLVIYFICSIKSIYMSVPTSQFIPPSPSPLVSIHLFSMSMSPLFLSFWNNFTRCPFVLFYRGIVDLQCFVNFCCTAKCFSYIYILFHVLLHYGLSEDIEYNSLHYTIRLFCLSIICIYVCVCVCVCVCIVCI